MRLQLPKAFKELFEPKRYKVYYGGRGGAKSWAFAIALLTMGMNRKIQVLCARELQVSIQDSVHRLLANVVESHEGFGAFYDVQQKNIIGKNGTEFAFKGLKHNINEIKSYEGADYCWVEEAQAVSKKSWETLIPTIRKEGSEIWLCFNPKNSTDPTWLEFVARPRRNSVVKKVNWADNPFFPAVLEEERQECLERDPDAYPHIWGGEFDTRYSGAVYAKFVKQEQISDKVIHDPNYPVYTAWDLGYDDATAIIFYQVGIGEIFIIDYYEASQEDVRHYCEVLAGREIIVDERDLDTGAILKWRYGEDIAEHEHRRAYHYHDDHAHFVPHDAANKVQAAGGKSIIEQAAHLGVKMFKMNAGSQQDDQAALRSVLPRCWIHTNVCADLIHALMNYHYEYDEDLKIFNKTPIHDHTSHACDAAEILAKVYQDRAVTTKELNIKAQRTKFHRLREENNLEAEDPYRLKKIKRGK